MIELAEEKPEIKRSDLLIKALAVGAGVVTGRALRQVIWRRTQGEPMDQDQNSSKSLSELLQATATAVVEKGEDTSFQEKGDFTKQTFERVRHSTFIVDTGKGTLTGWLAKREGNSLYVVVTRHAVYDPKIDLYPESISLWRPRIDREKFTTAQFDPVYYKEGQPVYDLDIAVIKCEDPEEQLKDIEPLAWRDNIIPDKGTYFMTVGFPTDFHPGDYANALTLGSVLKTEEVYRKTGWYGYGVVNGGSSGSPTAILENKQPLVVGMLYAVGWKHKAIATSLNLTPLIEQLSSV